MGTKKQILRITQTALLLGLTVAAQYYLTNILGGPANPASQLTVGSLVNLFLVISVLECGFWSGFSIGAVAPLIALSLGRLPHVWFLPFIVLGNTALVFTFWIIFRKKLFGPQFAVNWAAASVMGALFKFGVLWTGIAQIVLKLILYEALPPPQIEMLSFAFSMPQLATALTGCISAYAVYPALKKISAVNKINAKYR